MPDFVSQTLLFALEGVDLKRTVDKVSETRVTRGTDFVRNEDGAITSRPGYFTLARPIDGNTDEVHSLARLNIPRLSDYDRFAGIGTKIYCGKFSLSLLDTGYSGKPLSLLNYRPTLSSDSWLYVGDTLKNAQLKPGTSPTAYTPGFRIDEFSRTADGSFDSRERTRYTCFGFDIADNSGALPCIALPIGLPKAVNVKESFRIDEFARSADTDITARDRTRFTCFGFDISDASPGNYLTYPDTQKKTLVDYFETVSGWTDNAGTGGAPSVSIDTNKKQGTYSGLFTSNPGGAGADYYNYWIKNIVAGTSGGTGTSRDLDPIGIGSYATWFRSGGADSVQCVKLVDSYNMHAASAGDALTYFIQAPTDADASTPLTSFLVTFYPKVFDSDGNPATTTNAANTYKLRVRFGGVDYDSAAFGCTNGVAITKDFTASRAWTVGDLATTQIGALFFAFGAALGNIAVMDKLKATVAYTGIPPNPALNIATFPDGTELTDEDIMHVWMRIDHPELVSEVRLYFICSANTDAITLPGTDTSLNTDAYVKAFRPADFTDFFEATGTTLPTAVTANTNVQTIQSLNPVDDTRGGQVGLTNAQRELSRAASVETAPGRGQWTEFGIIGLPIRRGDFRRIGNDITMGWGNITGLALAVITNDNSAVQINLDDWYFTGGAGLDSSIPGNSRYNYRVVNYDPRTGDIGNPTDIQGPAYWLDSLRRAIRITPNAYGDGYVHQRFYRQGGSLVNNWYFVGENSFDGDSFTDTLSDQAIILAPTLEIDNDQPVTSVDENGTTLYAQPLPSLWGPIQDLILGCGDINRAGHLYWCKTGQPGSWPANNNVEVCDPSEELMAGFVFNGQSYVFSRAKLYSLLINLTSAGKVTPQPTSCTHGLISRTAFCLGYDAVYFVSSDGIYRTQGGQEENITDDILRPLFYNESKNGYDPIAFNSPDAIRIFAWNNDVWFIYRDINGINRTLIYSATMKYWRFYSFFNQIACGNPEVDNSNNTSKLLLGERIGGLVFSHEGVSDNGNNISPLVRTGALDQGFPRNNKLYGDFFLKADRQNTDIVVGFLLDDETRVLANQTLATGVGYQQYILDPFISSGDFGNPDPEVGRNISIEISWSSATNAPKILHGGPSYVLQPEITQQRATEWDSQGRLTDKYVKGVYLECDTGGVTKTVDIQADGVTQATISVNANGRKSLQFSFPQFLGRLLRIKPTDTNGWMYYQHRWIFDEEPAQLARWETQQLDHGIPGWKTPIYAYITLKSNADVTLTVTCYNQLGVGVDQTYTIPNTAGLVTPAHVPFNATKGTMYKYLFTSSAPFWLYREESVLYIQPSNGADLIPAQPFGDADLDGVRGMPDAGANSNRSGGGAR